jgi:RHS repeat-associated protein
VATKTSEYYDRLGRLRWTQDGEGYINYYSYHHLQLNRHRFYASHLGRWLTRDPIDYWGGTNLYAYVGGMPTLYLDPSGLEGYFQGWSNEAAAYLPWSAFPSASAVTRFALDANARNLDALIGGSRATGEHVGTTYGLVRGGEYWEATKQHLGFTAGNVSASWIA